MSRALVLGGGGPVGIGWQAGLLTGLADADVVLREADLVVGTSAGSVVGAQLTTGRTLADVVPPISKAPPWVAVEFGAESPDLTEMVSRDIGAAVPEADFLARFAFLGGAEWPEAFRCTSVDIETFAFAVWDRAAGVDLHRAVASSCSVPGLSPPVTLAGARYIDGGARDMLNADLAIGHDTVIAVSCMVLEPPEGRVPDLLAGLLPAVRARIEEVRASGSAVEVVEPSAEVCELSGWGRSLMDYSRTAAAFDAGVRQGGAIASRVGPFWMA